MLQIKPNNALALRGRTGRNFSCSEIPNNCRRRQVVPYGLDKNELAILNRIVSGYFDFAEIQAMRHNPMHMSDYIEHLDKILQSTGEKVLIGPGSVSHTQAMEKAKREYRKFQVNVLSPVEVAYLDTIKSASRIAKRKGRPTDNK